MLKYSFVVKAFTVFCATNGGVTRDRVVEEDLLITILDPQ